MELALDILKQIDIIINNNYNFSLLIFSLFILFYSALSLPGIAVIWLFSGYSFGIYCGFLISAIFTPFGAMLLFILSKTIFYKIFIKIFPKSINLIQKKLKNNSYEILIIFRMFPINLPFFIQNVGLSFLNISIFKFLITTLIGFTPMILLMVILGDTMTQFSDIESLNINNILSEKIYIIIGIIIFILILNIYFKKKLRK